MNRIVRNLILLSLAFWSRSLFPNTLNQYIRNWHYAVVMLLLFCVILFSSFRFFAVCYQIRDKIRFCSYWCCVHCFLVQYAAPHEGFLALANSIVFVMWWLAALPLCSFLYFPGFLLFVLFRIWLLLLWQMLKTYFSHDSYMLPFLFFR